MVNALLGGGKFVVHQELSRSRYMAMPGYQILMGTPVIPVQSAKWLYVPISLGVHVHLGGPRLYVKNAAIEA